MEFKDRLKELRNQKDISQDKLAEELGLSERSTVAHWEKGRQYPLRNTLHKIADYFNVSLDYLEGRSDIRSKDIVSALHKPGYVDEEVPSEVREEIERYARYLIDQHKKGEYKGKG